MTVALRGLGLAQLRSLFASCSVWTECTQVRACASYKRFLNELHSWVATVLPFVNNLMKLWLTLKGSAHNWLFVKLDMLPVLCFRLV